jgi:WD40 repeat protein
LKTVRCHDTACRTLCFVNDGSLLLTGSSDRSILATDVSTGKLLSRLTNAHKAPVNRLVAVDKNTIVSGDDDGAVKVWDTRQQKAVGQFAPFVDFVSDICHVPFGAGAGEQKIDATDPDAPGTSAQGASQGVNTHPGSLVVTSGDGTIAHLSLHNWKGTALRVSQIPASLFDHTRLTLFFYNERARAERHA